MKKYNKTLNRAIFILITQALLFTSLIYSEPVSNYNHLRVPMKFGNGGGSVQDDEREFINSLLAPVIDAHRAGNYEQAVKMHQALLMLGIGLGIITNGRDKQEVLISKALETLDPGNIIDREKLTLEIIKTAQDKSSVMIREMTIEHNRQELIKMNQPGTVQIVRGYVGGVGLNISSRSGVKKGFDISVDEIDWRAQNLTGFLSFLTLRVREEVCNGDILLLGPGAHIHEILMLIKVFPDFNSLCIADASMTNLIEIKKQLDARADIDKNKIKLYHADFDQLPFENSKFTVCYSRGVFHHSVNMRDEFLYEWVEEVKRVLKPDNGVYLTLWSERRLFEHKGFALKPDRNTDSFIASVNESVFNQPSLLSLVSSNQQLDSSL